MSVKLFNHSQVQQHIYSNKKMPVRLPNSKLCNVPYVVQHIAPNKKKSVKLGKNDI